jgi:integrase
MPARMFGRRIPSYRHHRGSGQAVVTLDGRDHYLGKYGSVASRAEYDRLIGEWMAHGRRLPAPAGGPADLTVAELILAYLRHAETYYVKNGEPTSELANIKAALKPLRALFGRTPAAEFGPLRLKAVRQRYVVEKLCRNECNKRTGKVVRVFRWGVEQELIPATVHHGLTAVAGLRKGRCEARESAPVRPVPEAHVEAVRLLVTPTVRAMIDVQLATGARPGEVCMMRTCDLDTTGGVWVYTPRDHKTSHHDRERTIYLGPVAQAAIRDRLRPDVPEAYIFSPRRAKEEWAAARRAARKTPMTPSQHARKRKARPKLAPGGCYDPRSYAHAIASACHRAGIDRWGPNRLRHLAATRLRKRFGLEGARVILGHSSPAITTVYAEQDRSRAAEIMAQVG